MRKLSASYLFPLSHPPLKHGILEISKSGEIISLYDTGGYLRETSSLEYFNGIIIPGCLILDLANPPTYKSEGLNPHSLWARGLQARILISKGNQFGKGLPEESQTPAIFAQKAPLDLKLPIKGLSSKQKPVHKMDKEQGFYPGVVSMKAITLQKDLIEEKPGERPQSWFLFDKDTLSKSHPEALFQFFKSNHQRILYAWEDLDARELTQFIRLFTRPSEGIYLQQALLPLTWNPAKFAGINTVLGALEKGMRPGICLIEGIDFRNMCLREEASIRRLV